MSILAEPSEAPISPETEPNPLSVTAKSPASGTAVWCSGPSWVFPVAPAELPVPSREPGELQRWAREHEGIPASGTCVNVDVRVLAAHAVTVDAVRVAVIRRRRAPAGTAALLYDRSVAWMPNFLVADLDRAPVVVRPAPGIDASGHRIPALAFPHALAPGSSESWYIQAQTAGFDCDWFAYLDWTSNARSGSIRIDDDGLPFRTAAIRRATWASADPAARKWSMF